tara:strand:- start:320 stop:811 length:492 start_codon:yes stop_codon:yes gene_type:complete
MGKNDNGSIYYDINEISDDFFHAIGMVTVSFANLELKLSLFCGAHIGSTTPIVNQIITSELSFKQLINISIAIYKEVQLDEEKVNEFLNLSKDLFTLEQRRNSIIHSNYGALNNYVVRQKTSSKGKKGFKMQQEDLTPEALIEFVCNIESASSKIGIILFEIS